MLLKTLGLLAFAGSLGALFLFDRADPASNSLWMFDVGSILSYDRLVRWLRFLDTDGVVAGEGSKSENDAEASGRHLASAGSR